MREVKAMVEQLRKCEIIPESEVEELCYRARSVCDLKTRLEAAWSAYLVLTHYNTDPVSPSSSRIKGDLDGRKQCSTGLSTSHRSVARLTTLPATGGASMIVIGTYSAETSSLGAALFICQPLPFYIITFTFCATTCAGVLLYGNCGPTRIHCSVWRHSWPIL